MLKKLFSANVVESNLFPTNVTTGLLKPDDRILHWVVTHIICPKQGGYSIMDKVEVHLVYVLKHKLKVNWPHYIVSRIFALKKSGRGTALCYPSFIQSILNQAEVSIPGIQYNSVTANQEFYQKSLSLMGYTWDPTVRIYKIRTQASSSNIQHLEDDDNDDDDDDEDDEDEEENNDDDTHPMEHDQQVTDHGDWLGATPGPKPSDNQGWGEWQHTG